MNKRAEIMTLMAALGEYYDKALTPTQLAAYTEDLMCFELTELVQSILIYRNDPRNDRFPLPVKLKAMMGVAISPEDEAIQIAGRILGAIARIGPYDASRARVAIGEVGWKVVECEGGWESICEVDTDDLPIRKAQWRNLARTFCENPTRRSEQINLQEKGLIPIGGILRLVPKPNEENV